MHPRLFEKMRHQIRGNRAREKERLLVQPCRAAIRTGGCAELFSLFALTPVRGYQAHRAQPAEHRGCLSFLFKPSSTASTAFLSRPVDEVYPCMSSSSASLSLFVHASSRPPSSAVPWRYEERFLLGAAGPGARQPGLPRQWIEYEQAATVGYRCAGRAWSCILPLSTPS